jgi:FlaA1/EpsC-like NDP-sugar epimerase/lipopolysaccharide/colanic/teichoic acid biosynthesis glycosyltransferase
MKRTLDLLVAAAGLLALSPLFILIAAWIKLDSAGPVLFRQARVGRGFRTFHILKFRTMQPDAERRGPQVTSGGDARITRAGHWLRATKLDELPQLFNVLRGEMSLVGPRPEVPRYVERFRDDFAGILAVRPGITDLASLKYRHEADLLARAADPEAAYVADILPDKIRLAKHYVAHASLALDAQVLWRTLLGLCAPAPALPREGRGGRRALLQSLLKHRRALVVTIHLGMIVLANYLAFWLRFDGTIPAPMFALFLQFLLPLIAVRAATFAPLRLYEGLWRYTSLWDLRNILTGVAASTALFFVLVHVVLDVRAYPRSIYLIDAILLVCGMASIRLTRRLYADLARTPRDRRVLIYGAGDAGEMVVRDMLRHPDSDYEPVGFIDDDAEKYGERIHGIPVLGGRADLPRLVQKYAPSEILVALPGASRAAVRGVVSALESFNIPIATVPSLGDLRNGLVTIEQIRRMKVEDLLERRAVDLDLGPLDELIRGQSVMVTGAGGSIGSELCRQIGVLRPAQLLLFERYENSLYQIATDLLDRSPSLPVLPLLGDITDRARVDNVLSIYRPSVIFHAAAHKHVPLMEVNPCEAVKNNVMGTRILAESAVAHGVARVVLISSDKAVNPSSVMGATKRVAELLTRSLNRVGATRFITVRFGNVLGSNGSVVPRFLEQIKAGGPVTVTHPEMRRYFMLIPEAVQLVLHAAALDEGGGIYVLEMGEQIRLVDLARNLIRLSGHVPDQDIAIEFTALRPGEKLAEELVGSDETAERASAPSIIRVRWTSTVDVDAFRDDVRRLESLALDGRPAETVRQLQSLVPTFTPDSAVHTLPAPQAVPAPVELVRAERRRSPFSDRRKERRGGRRWYDGVNLPPGAVEAPAQPPVDHVS